MRTTLIAVLLLVSLTSFAQEKRRFWDNQTKRDFMITAGLRGADIGLTCALLANGGRERWTGSQSCAKNVAIIGSGQAVQTFAQWIAYKTHHEKIRRRIPEISIVGSTVAISYTLWNWGHKRDYMAGDQLPATMPDGRNCTATYNGTRWVLVCP